MLCAHARTRIVDLRVRYAGARGPRTADRGTAAGPVTELVRAFVPAARVRSTGRGLVCVHRTHGTEAMWLLGVVAVVVTMVEAKPVRLIIDTDMSGDCDDVGAVCLAHALELRGEAELLAVVHNTGLDTGVGAISAINTYYGRPDLPVGAYKGTFNRGLRGPYVDDLVQRFPAQVHNASTAPDAVAVYRQALAATPDASVWISSIGFTTNLESLLRSKPDATSPLSGAQLVAAKVKGLAWMGGRYPDSSRDPESPNLPSPEHNFGFFCTANNSRCSGIGSDPIAPSTAFVVEHWPASVPIVFLGWEVGAPIKTGAVITNGTATHNPCRQAYIDHGNGVVGRSSWDPATTLFAIRGVESFYSQVFGKNFVNSTNGSNVFVPSRPGNDTRSQSYLVQKSSVEAVRDAINELLLMPPRLNYSMVE